MSPVSVTCRRTLAHFRGLFSTAISVAGFLAATAVLFAFNLEAAEGTRQTLAEVWAVSAAPFLPILAALLAMDTWSEERRTGRIDLLLSIAVRERDCVLGSAAGVWFVLALSLVFSLAATVAALAFCAPAALEGVRHSAVLPALFVLLLQGALWSAASVFFSTLFTRGFVAALTSVTVLSLLPRGLWAAALLWSPAGRTAYGVFPLDAHVTDFASGLLSPGLVAIYAALAVLSLFLASKSLSLARFSGAGAAKGRAGTLLAMALALVCALSFSALAWRLNVAFDLPLSGTAAFSPRLNRVLSEVSGRLTVTCFLPRKDRSFRSVAHMLRAFRRQAETVGGLSVAFRFVDPNWDLGAAERLIRMGVPANSIVLEKGHRLRFFPVQDVFDDLAVAAAIQHLIRPLGRQDVCWTVGHGELGFDSYGTWGLSDIARDLVREGFRNRPLDLAAAAEIPAECALVVVAGAKDCFSRVELARLDAYLKSGGRLLVLMSGSGDSGVAPLLPSWGLRPVVRPLAGASTISGSDVIVSEFSDHAVSGAFAGSRLILEKPLSFVSSAATESVGGADRIEFSALASVGSAALAVAVERGGEAGDDLALRPTRIVAIGDPTFVMNGQLGARACANRDFFLNAVAYLAGMEAFGAGVSDSDRLQTEMDRRQRVRFLLLTALAVPGALFVLLSAGAFRRRRRT